MTAAATLALQRLYDWAERQPDAVCLTQPMGQGQIRTFTWREVLDQSSRMAAHLQAQGWPAGSKVAILSKNCAWWLMSDLAIWMAGHVSVPLYPTLAAGTVKQILDHSEARACFVGKLDGWEAMSPGVPQHLHCISYALSPDDARARYPGWDDLCKATAPLASRPQRQADELATLIYTSGTTGAPKGVMHSFGNFAWAIETGIKRIPLLQSDRMLSYLPLSHVVERVLVEHGWLWTGMHLYFAESLDTFAQDLQRAQPTVFFSVPRLWTKFQQGVLAKLPQKKLDRLLGIPLIGSLVRRKIMKALGLNQCRLAVGGAAPMPPALLQWFDKLGLHINEGYGMTENLCISHITEPGKDQTGSVGTPYPGVELRIDAMSGELMMRCPALMLGYYKEPDLTRETLTEDGWLHTGDKAAKDERGSWRITGRVKDLFKTSKGKYVSPAPIEEKLGVHPAIEACAVSGANLSQPVGLVMLSQQAAQQAADASGRQALQAELDQHLQALNIFLDPHEQLACLVAFKTPWTVDNGLITPTFKVRRPRVEELYGSQLAAWSESRQSIIFAD